MLKACSVIVALSSIGLAGAVCNLSDQTAFEHPETPSQDLISKCTEATIGSDFKTNCFSGSTDSWTFVNNDAVSMSCANCIYAYMDTALSGTTSDTIQTCLTALGTINGTDCTAAVDTIILSTCASTWTFDNSTTAAPTEATTTDPSANGSLSTASTLAVTGALIVSAWSA